MWAGASADHGVQRIGEHPAWATVEALDIVEVTRLFEVALDEPHVPTIIQLVPDGDSFRGKTTI